MDELGDKTRTAAADRDGCELTAGVLGRCGPDLWISVVSPKSSPLPLGQGGRQSFTPLLRPGLRDEMRLGYRLTRWAALSYSRRSGGDVKPKKIVDKLCDAVVRTH